MNDTKKTFLRSRYTKEEEDTFEKRAIEYIKNKPDASRKKIADYAGVGISVLERLEKNGNFKLPKPMSVKQIRKKFNWTNF
jgi:hypothetical protein